MLNATQLADRIRAQVQAGLAGANRPTTSALPGSSHTGRPAANRPAPGADANAIQAMVQARLQAARDRFTGLQPGQPSSLALPAIPGPMGRAPLPVRPQPGGPLAPAPTPPAGPRPVPTLPPVTGTPAASGDTSRLLGAMSAEDIEHVLTQRGSKLAGQGYGEYILSMEQKYGVPAAQFLAQAVKESQIGSDDGYAQPGFNIGNIRPGTSWTGPVVNGGSGPFRVYGSWEEGIEDYFRLLAGPLYAGKSLKDQIYTYAPPSENDTNRYYTDVVALIDQWTGIRM